MPKKKIDREVPAPEFMVDGLASEWTHDETIRAQMTQDRRSDDIPYSDYGLYQSCFDETLEEPDEVWSLHTYSEETMRLFHFIRHYPDKKSGVWFVVVAREVENEEQIEILDAFPTRDPGFVEKYRQGEQEVGASRLPSQNRVVH